MRKGLLGSLAAVLLCGNISLAQSPTVEVPTAPDGPLPAAQMPESSASASGLTPADWCAPASSCCNYRIWASKEYLLWWFNGDRLSAPIVTTVTPGTTVPAGQVPGAIGSAGTQVVNPSVLNYGPFSGGRLTVGAWLDNTCTVGIEGNGFVFGTRSSTFLAASQPGGTTYYVPFQSFGAGPPSASAFPFGAFGATSGYLAAVDTTRLWGSEVNGVLTLVRDDRHTLTLLGGFRYLDLSESLDLPFQAYSGPFSTFSLDEFGTRNQFWGGQLGLRGETRMGNFFAAATAKVALGDMHQSVTTNGGFVFAGPGVSATGPGGFFVLPSNLGRQTHDAFAVVPQVGLQVGYNLTRTVRVFAGYEFLYISDVVRPGNQIDPRVNFSQQAVIGGAGLVGPAVPQLLGNHTDFWANGVSIGMQLRF